MEIHHLCLPLAQKKAFQKTHHVLVTPNPVLLQYLFVSPCEISPCASPKQLHPKYHMKKMLLSLIISSKSPSHWNTERHWALKPKITTFSIFLVLQRMHTLLSLLNSLFLGSHSSTLNNTKGFPEMTKPDAWPLQWQMKDSEEDLLFNR